MHIRDRVKELRRVKASDLLPHPRNWRTHPKAQRAAMEGVLAEIGYADALLVRELEDGRLQLIDGHLRADTTPESEVPVLVLDVDESEADKLLLTHDPLAAMAEANNEHLAELLASCETDSADVRAMIDDLAKQNGLFEFPSVVEDDVPLLPADPVTKPGDLWVLGEHRLLCGDSTKRQNVARVMNGERAGLMNTDPPYGIAYDSAALHHNNTSYAAIEHDGVDGERLQSFLEDCIRAAVPYLIDNAPFYLWHPMLTQGTFFAAAAAAAAAADILISRQIIWVKPQLIFGRGEYHWKHELCFYGWRRGYRPEFLGDRNQTTVWEIGYGEGRNDREHPTQKPVELFARPILNHLREGELAYEPFGGSGSQFIAAEQLNRRCYGLEISPAYCDVIVQRWERLAGFKATLEKPAKARRRKVTA